MNLFKQTNPNLKNQGILTVFTLFFSFLLTNQLSAQCPTGDCSTRETIIYYENLPTCNLPSESYVGDIQGDVCLDGSGKRCYKFIIRRNTTTEEVTFNARIGQGNSCNGELDAAYSMIGNNCTTLSTGGAQTGLTFTFPIGVSEVVIFGCINSNASVCLTGVCRPCKQTASCVLQSTVNIQGCSIPAALTNPADVFTFESCGETASLKYSDAGDTNVCGDGNGASFTRTYTLSFNNVEFTQCQQSITVSDLTPPEVTCPTAQTVTCAGLVPTPSISSVTVKDNCTPKNTVKFVSDVIDNKICDNKYTITRTYEATDLCGNTASCTQTITVNDNVSPSLNGVPANTTIECSDKLPTVPSVTGTDNCGGTPGVAFSESRENGNCVNNYKIIRTWVATDACGNTASQSQVITVNDTKAPTLVGVPNNVTISCSDQVPTVPSVTATDNCSNSVTPQFNEKREDGSCVNNYTLIRTWTAIDECGNSATKSQVITVEDKTPPTLSQVPADITVKCAADVPTAPVLNATDNCSGTPTVKSSDYKTGVTCANRFTIKRTWTATDVCGNTTSKTQTITVYDDVAPEIVKKGELASCYPSLADAEAAALGLTSATDNCGGTVTRKVSSKLGCPIIVTVTATDVCGNSSSVDYILQDIAAVGGRITYNGQNNYTICPDENITINLTGYTGRITKWQYTTASSSTWIDIPSSIDIKSLVINGNDINQTYYYRAEICALCGKCLPPYYTAYSKVFTVYKRSSCSNNANNTPSQNPVQLRQTVLAVLKAYPSPATDNLTVEATGFSEGIATIEILDFRGSVVYNEKRSVTKGFNIISLSIGRIASGLYILRITDADGRKSNFRINKF